MNDELNARSTTYRVADDVIYDPREGDVFRMGNNWECVVLGRVADDGFDCVRFCSVVGTTRTERTINLNEWIDRCAGRGIERLMSHHVRNRKVLHVAQFPHKASDSGTDRVVDELADLILGDVLVLLAGQGYPTPERGYRLDGGWSLALADLKRCFGELRAKLASVEAERDAGRAERDELRRKNAAKESLIREWIRYINSSPGQKSPSAAKRFVADIKSRFLGGEFDSLDWLDRQRAEAAVEELKKLGPLGSSNQELFMVPWGEIKQRIQELEAAALRAGEGEVAV